MKWPFDPRQLSEVEALFVFFMVMYALSYLWVAWVLLVVGGVTDFARAVGLE